LAHNSNPPVSNEVIVAAGGLGTRIHRWARFFPKEFYPLHQRPSVLYLFDEILSLGPSTVHFVYHPYYDPFISWIRHLLSHEGLKQYDTTANRLGKNVGTPLSIADLDIRFIRQQGRYSDLSSLLTCEHLLRSDSFYLLFADFLYLDGNPLLAMRQDASMDPLVLAKPFNTREIERRGLIITRTLPNDQRRIVDIVEKPTLDAARRIARQHGEESLFMAEGRFRLTRKFSRTVSLDNCLSYGEPKLSLAIRNYARSNPVGVVITHSSITDLGTEKDLA
jgi:UTP-glucose-1-phosphate uridylyltransferase